MHDEGVQICITGGFKTNFFSILYIYIYIYKFGSGGSFEPSNYIVPPPYSVISFQFSVKKAVSKQTHSFDFFFFLIFLHKNIHKIKKKNKKNKKKIVSSYKSSGILGQQWMHFFDPFPF